jgi:hypothetical protein
MNDRKLGSDDYCKGPAEDIDLYSPAELTDARKGALLKIAEGMRELGVCPPANDLDLTKFSRVLTVNGEHHASMEGDHYGSNHHGTYYASGRSGSTSDSVGVFLQGNAVSFSYNVGKIRVENTRGRVTLSFFNDADKGTGEDDVAAADLRGAMAYLGSTIMATTTAKSLGDPVVLAMAVDPMQRYVSELVDGIETDAEQPHDPIDIDSIDVSDVEFDDMVKATAPPPPATTNQPIEEWFN